MEEATNKLYVGNLPYTASDADLNSYFAAAGEVTEVAIITDKMSGRSKGFGFVTMKDAASADKAVKELDGKDFQGRPLRISIARPMRTNDR
jgi:RNA recognition motif-containing protein